MGRRNATPEQMSLLRGERYNLEKRDDGGHGDQKSGGHCDRPNVADALGKEYKVGEKTIRRDGAFADAVGILAEVAGEDVKAAILAPRGAAHPPTATAAPAAARFSCSAMARRSLH